jgi:NlpC/P60 family
MAGNAKNSDISAEEGAKITAEAQTWKGTPYKLVGAGSIKNDGGDCSGSTWRIYTAAGFTYEYRNTSTFIDYVTQKKKFREIPGGDPKQEGDLLFWPDHVAIYTTFAADKDDASTDRVNKKGQHWTQVNDIWTATNPTGGPYQPAKMSFFKTSPPRVFRYQK